MATKANTDNPFSNISEFYFKLAEQAAPVLKQGIEDWYTIYAKVWTEGLKLQSDWLRQITGKEGFSGFTQHSKEFGEKTMEAQKKVSTDIVDATMKGVRSFNKVAKKTPRKVAKKTPRKVAKKTPRKVAKKTPRKVAKKTPHKVAKKTPRKVAKKTPRKVAKKTPRKAKK